jgi:hypothetical protein
MKQLASTARDVHADYHGSMGEKRLQFTVGRVLHAITWVALALAVSKLGREGEPWFVVSCQFFCTSVGVLFGMPLLGCVLGLLLGITAWLIYVLSTSY